MNVTSALTAGHARQHRVRAGLGFIGRRCDPMGQRRSAPRPARGTPCSVTWGVAFAVRLGGLTSCVNQGTRRLMERRATGGRQKGEAQKERGKRAHGVEVQLQGLVPI